MGINTKGRIFFTNIKGEGQNHYVTAHKFIEIKHILFNNHN